MSILFISLRSQQRLDSVHIQPNMRHLGRIGIVVQPIHKFLVNLKRQHPILFGTLPAELADRYLPEKALVCFSMVKPSESERTLNQVCQDLFELVQRMSDHSAVPSMSSFQLLQRVLQDQGHIQEASIQVESATVHDTHALVPALEAATEQGLKPTQVLADSAYGSEDNLERAQELGVEVVAPAMGTYGSQRLPLSAFVFSETGEVLRCPQGQEPERVRRKQGRFRVAFPLTPYADCPVLPQCPTKLGKRYRYLGYDHKVFRLAQRRQVEQTDLNLWKRSFVLRSWRCFSRKGRSLPTL